MVGGDCQMRPEEPKIEVEGRDRWGCWGGSSKLGGLGIDESSTSGVQGGAPTAQRFSTIPRRMASPVTIILYCR